MSETTPAKKLPLIPMQVAAGRALLRLSLSDLAAATGLTAQTIAKFESGERVRPETVDTLLSSLRELGLEFSHGDQPGVRLNPHYKAPTLH
jgi:transcriptional regulator with XRE-family HTH domain